MLQRLLLGASLLLFGASCASRPRGAIPEGPAPAPTTGDLDLIVIAAEAPRVATLLIDAGDSVALVDGGPLGRSLARLLELCHRFDACTPDHAIITPASGGGPEALLFLLAGPDKEPGTSDDILPTGAFLRAPPLPVCDDLACLGLQGLDPGAALARHGDTLLLGTRQRLRLDLEAASPRLLVSKRPDSARGAILWGPGACVLDAGAERWRFADLTRCPAGGIQISEGRAFSGLAILGAGHARCVGLKADLQRLTKAGARGIVLGGKACDGLRGTQADGIDDHLILHLERDTLGVRVLGADGKLTAIAPPLDDQR